MPTDLDLALAMRVTRCTHCPQCPLTIVRHPHGKALLKPTVLTFISTFFVDPTVKITPIINKLQPDGSSEKTLQRDMENRQFLSLCDTWKQQPVDKDILTDLDIRINGFGLEKIAQSGKCLPCKTEGHSSIFRTLCKDAGSLVVYSCHSRTGR